MLQAQLSEQSLRKAWVRLSWNKLPVTSKLSFKRYI